jgi:hypothetical protein
MPDIKPDRTNWKSFCTQQPLSESEHAEWDEMAKAMKENYFAFLYVEAHTKEEFDALWSSERDCSPDRGWQALVDNCDARTILSRAEIEAYRKWLEVRETRGSLDFLVWHLNSGHIHEKEKSLVLPKLLPPPSKETGVSRIATPSSPALAETGRHVILVLSSITHTGFCRRIKHPFSTS